MTNDSSSGDSSAGFPPPEHIPQPGATPSPGGYPHQGEYPPPGGYPGDGLKPPPGSYPPPVEHHVPYGVPAGNTAFRSRRRNGEVAPFHVGEVLSFAWGRFRDNVGTWLAFMLLSIAASLLVVFPMSLVFFAPVADSGSGTALVLTLGAAGVALIVLVGMLLQAAMVRAALAESAQDRPSLRHFFKIRNVSQALLAMVIVAILTFAGLLLFVLPGVLVAFFSMFAVHFAVDQNISAIDAVKSSWRAVGANIGPLLLLVLVLYLINLAGALILIGFLVTVPLAAIAVALAYRRITGTA